MRSKKPNCLREGQKREIGDVDSFSALFFTRGIRQLRSTFPIIEDPLSGSPKENLLPSALWTLKL